MAPIPITIVTGFLGSGKTTLILNLIPQLRARSPAYRLALLKNEFGDLAVDSQLASSGSIAGVREMLGGCVCCNLVGDLKPALAELEQASASASGAEGGKGPDRIVIETSGSAFPATLALEVNRLARETGGRYVLDGVVSVVDVENWKGYEDTSYTAKVQARYTDLVVFNKWEAAGEDRYDECLDRLGDLDVDVAKVKSDKGWVSVDVVFGVDGGLARHLTDKDAAAAADGHHHHHDGHEEGHKHSSSHQSEVEVLSIELKGESSDSAVSTDKLLGLLKQAPKEELYRIKAVLTLSAPPTNSDPDMPAPGAHPRRRYILNWALWPLDVHARRRGSGRARLEPGHDGTDDHHSRAVREHEVEEED